MNPKRKETKEFSRTNDVLSSRYEQLLGEPLQPAAKRDCLRINPILAPKDIIKRLEKKGMRLEKVPFLPHGYWYTYDKSAGATAEYLLGYYYLQEAASQLPALVLAAKKHATVLDMAASPGGKTTQLAAMMDNTGVIIAVEQKSNRMEALVENLERCGVKNAVLFRKDSRFVKDFHKKFDYILLDAPCSGNYVIEEKYFDKKSMDTIKEMQALQRELLKAAVEVLAPGGTLVYSTCTLEPEENEENIDWLLGKYDSLHLEDMELTVGQPGYTEVFGKKLHKDIKKTRRLWPQKTGTQAFFIAKIKK